LPPSVYIRATCKTPFSFILCVMLKYLSSEYQFYASGKYFSHALTLNENHHFAKGSSVNIIREDKDVFLVQEHYIGQ